MNSDTQKTQEMTEFQVREAYTTLLREHQQVVEAARRFTTFVFAKDPALTESFFGPGAAPAAVALGVALPAVPLSELKTQPSMIGETLNG